MLALYDTVAEPLPRPSTLAAARAADYITFTSSSTVRFYLESGEIGPATRIASIGPVTSRTLREHGLEPDVEADGPRHRRPGRGNPGRRAAAVASRRCSVGLLSVITFLSDYGYTDEFVGVCHGVLATWCPQAKVIDITHGIRRHDIRAGAVALRGAVPYMPPGVHLAVVDPDVGRPDRRAVAVRTAARNHLLVGPDNGLLALAADRLGGVVEAIDIGDSPYRLDPVCATFHGRDIFSPVAAALASGAKLEETGQPFDPPSSSGSTSSDRGSTVTGSSLRSVTIDQFGNVELNVDHEQIAEFGLRVGMAVELTVNGDDRSPRTTATRSPTHGAIRCWSTRTPRTQLAVAVNHGSAAAAARHRAATPSFALRIA